MRTSRLGRFVIGTILAAYMVPAILSPRSVLGEIIFFKLNSSLSVRNDRIIDTGERPYWTSRRYLASLEQFSNDHILSATESWINVDSRDLFVELEAMYPPTPGHLFPQNIFRAPPLS